ncbi:MAG: hypothetical protein HYY30_01865 [Chloroflexi bacterium]|nr:hypothetical protein [Chloroflexota bacterium]
MMPSRHAAISLGLGLVLWWITSSFLSLVLTMIAGFLIDVDHFVEYFRFRLWKKSDKLFIVLHSFEWLLPGWILAFMFHAQSQALVITLAFLTHLLADAYAYGARLQVYSLTYRALRGFDFKVLAKSDKSEQSMDWLQKGPRSWW